jgi:hypothetical protein
VVPPVTRAGAAAFAAYKAEREEASRREWEEYKEVTRRGQERRSWDGWRPDGEAGDWFEMEWEKRRREAAWRDVLGVEGAVTLDQVKARYRELAMEHHPDRGGDQAEFVRVQKAFEQAKAELGG